MKRLTYKCTLLDDVIISAQTATEGEHQSLSFIPGSNFLGILASLVYKKNDQDNFLLFHSAKVRFGDAHIVCNNKRSLQVPFSWYYPKGGKLTEGDNYMLNFMKNDNFSDLINKSIQLKQARDGYFTEDGKYLSITKIYSQKSKTDSEKRQSAKSEMFGYEALQRGSDMLFFIDIDNDISSTIIEQIKKIFGGKKLGRSKTAEFGRCKIEFIDEHDKVDSEITPREIILENKIVNKNNVSFENTTHKIVLLYAESRLSFLNQYGQPTYSPSAEQLGLPSGSVILWERSQIRTGVYAPWNKKRSCRDEDRVFIEKGSVFVIDVSAVNERFTNKIINKAVGLYRTEGFGQILINPNFLIFNPETGKLIVQLNENKEQSKYVNRFKEIPQDAHIIKWLQNFSNPKDETLEKAEIFIRDQSPLFKNVSNSQWGTIRSFVKEVKDKEELMSKLFDPENGYLTHGIALEQWKDGKEMLKNTIEKMENKFVLGFVEKLASRMQKKEVENEIQL